MINLLNPDGTFNENAGTYAGLDRCKASAKRVVDRPGGAGPAAKVEDRDDPR